MAAQKVREMEPVETQIVEIMPPDIEKLIYVVRNKQVMVDSDLAMLYQVETGALNRAVKRNIASHVCSPVHLGFCIYFMGYKYTEIHFKFPVCSFKSFFAIVS